MQNGEIVMRVFGAMCASIFWIASERRFTLPCVAAISNRPPRRRYTLYNTSIYRFNKSLTTPRSGKFAASP
jgi:hypothetical protein